MKRVAVTVLGWIGVGVLSTACGGGATSVPGTKSANEVAASGMSQTFAGKNKCNAKSHDRPFIIEWDATDMSSFEAHTADDIVFVKYEGCDMQVIESCRNDSVKGSLGSYKPVSWTSGSLESLDINNEGELYAKLPLGVASLGGRVEGGEKFHMEYYVSGTRTATRDAVYRNDLASIPGCKEATHFVYGYNLGAFALGAQSDIKGSVGGSYFGFGAGASRSSSSKADKKGGDLGTCKGESAKEVESCKVPIRLTLREISAGDSADTKDAQAPETPSAMNLAGKLKASTERQRKAEEHANTARTKMSSRDGKGCIDELNQHDKLDPRPSGLSTNPASYYALARGQCLMLMGQCPAGKQLARKYMETTNVGTMGPEVVDKSVDGLASMYCQGGSMAPRDQLLKAEMELQQGAYMSKKDTATCMNDYQTIKRLIPVVQPQDEDDQQVKNAPSYLTNVAPSCFAKAGDCQTAWTVFQEAWKAKNPSLNDGTLSSMFGSLVTRCKGK